MQSTVEATRSYRVLSRSEREEIMIGRRTDESLRSIARRLGRNVSVITREIDERNQDQVEHSLESMLAQRIAYFQTHEQGEATVG